MAGATSAVNTDIDGVHADAVYVPETVAGSVQAGEGVVNQLGGTPTIDANNNWSAPGVMEIASEGVPMTKGSHTSAESFPVVIASDQAFNFTGYIAAADHVAIAAGKVGNTTVKGSAGTFMGILVTVTGTNPLVVRDAAGDIIGYVPANASPGAFYPASVAAATSIVVTGNANNPGVTAFYS